MIMNNIDLLPVTEKKIMSTADNIEQISELFKNKT